MTFFVSLDVGAVMAPAASRDLDFEGDLDEIAIPLCGLLADAGAVFSAGGFGDEKWPVDIRYDFAGLVPDLPAVVQGIRHGSPVELDFFEQGLERTVTVAFEADRAVLDCRSSGRWVPSQPSDQMPRAAFESMIDDLVAGFLRAVAVVAPEVAGAAALDGLRGPDD